MMTAVKSSLIGFGPPRGISKEKAKIDFWPKKLAPSTELRRWYGPNPEKWAEPDPIANFSVII